MLNFLNKYVFGTAVPIMLVLAGIYYTFILKAFHIRHAAGVCRAMTKKQDRNGVSPFRAVTLALAGTLGVGNIVGVSAAIYMGGFGSIFWMWISSVCAMLLKYAEIVLAMLHRRFDTDGRPHGCAMYYIRDGLRAIGAPRFGVITAAVFAVFCIINSMTMGSVIQVNAVTDSFEGIFGIPPLLTGAVLALITAAVISSGSDRISRLTEKLVPFMTLGYIILSVAVMIMRSEDMGTAFRLILSDAFSPDSAAGGIFGFILSRSLRYGTMRGLVSNESGCGTAPTAHATSNSRIPAEQGFWGIFEVFADTIVLCSMTAFVVIISYPEVSRFGDNFIMMTISAYSSVLGEWAGYFLAVAVLCFAFATVICWAHYGMESVAYLSGKRLWKNVYIVFYSLAVFAGAFAASDIIWQWADFSIGVMTVINVCVICLMSREVKMETADYFRR